MNDVTAGFIMGLLISIVSFGIIGGTFSNVIPADKFEKAKSACSAANAELVTLSAEGEIVCTNNITIRNQK